MKYSTEQFNSIEVSKKYFENQQWELFLDSWLKNKTFIIPKYFYYNLGIANNAMGHLGLARYHLEKSLWLGFEGTRVQEELNDVLSKLNLRTDNWCQVNFKLCSWEFVKAPRTEPLNDPFLWGAIILFFLAFLSNKRLRILFGFTVASLSFVLSLYIRQGSYFVGIVINDTELRNGPSRAFPVVRKINEGHKIFTTKSFGTHFYVEFTNGEKGWIARTDLAFL